MEELIELVELHQDKNRAHSASLWHSKRAQAERCLEQAEALLELRPILQQRASVCSSEQAQLLEQYHRRHLKGRRRRQRPVTAPFLALYSNQVALECKLNLVRSLNQASGQLRERGLFERALPWSSGAQATSAGATCDGRAVERLVDNIAVQPKQIDACVARYALSNVRSFNQLAELLEQERAEPQEAKLEPERQQVSGAPSEELYLVVSDKDRPRLEQMLEACAQLEPVYENSIMPIVRLLRLGYNPEHDQFERLCRSSEQMRDWCTVTLVCRPLLSSHLNDARIYREFRDRARDKSLVVVDQIEAAANDELGQERPTERPAGSRELDSLLKSIQVPLGYDELWLSNYKQTKFERLLGGAYRGILRAFNVKNEADNIIFRRKVRGYGRMTWKLVLIALTAAALSLSPR